MFYVMRGAHWGRSRAMHHNAGSCGFVDGFRDMQRNCTRYLSYQTVTLGKSLWAKCCSTRARETALPEKCHSGTSRSSRVAKPC